MQDETTETIQFWILRNPDISHVVVWRESFPNKDSIEYTALMRSTASGVKWTTRLLIPSKVDAEIEEDDIADALYYNRQEL